MVTVKLRKSRPEELQYFCDIEAGADTRDHITPYSLQKHQHEFASINIVYLSICADNELVGFFILALEVDNQSVLPADAAQRRSVRSRDRLQSFNCASRSTVPISIQTPRNNSPLTCP